MNELYQLARKFAKKKHGDQMYSDDKPYVFHLDNVAQMCKKFGLPIESQIVALLHDILEDTDATFSEIHDLFGGAIAWNVRCLSRSKDTVYFDYIEHFNEPIFKIAKQVKVCDLLSNLEWSIRNSENYGSLIKRYQKALFILLT